MDITKFTSGKFLLVAGLLLLILIFLAIYPVYGSRSDVFVLTTILMYIILTVSWAMFSGSTGYMSLAPAAFFGVGIYTSALLYSEKWALLPLPAVIIIAGVASFVIALLVGLVTLRLKGIYFAIFTFGLVVLISQLLVFWELQIVGKRGQDVIAVSGDTVYYIMLGILVVTLLAVYFIRRSRLGLAMQSIGGNEEAAAHMGVNTTRVKVLSFAISAVFMGAAGAIMATKWIYVDPTVAFNVFYSFMPVLMAVFGGMGQFYGPIIGAAIFAYTERTLRLEFPYYYMLSFGIILILVILYLPGGLVGLIPRLQKVPVLQKLRDKLWGPIPELGKERTWKPTAAGIVSIIGGFCQVLGGMVFAVGSRFLAQFTGMEFIGGVIGWFSGFYAIIAALIIVFGVIAILGGLCALRRSSWGLALAGSICALPLFIFGIPAIIFVILSKGEFKYAMEKGGEAEQYANT